MPITCEVKPDQQLVIFWHVGDVPDDELLTFYKDFFEDPKAGGYLNLLIHLEQTRSTGRSSQALRSLAGLLEEGEKDNPVQRRVAVVAPGDNSFGLARMYEVLSDRIPWEFSVFRDIGGAQAWLGVVGGSDSADPPDEE